MSDSKKPGRGVKPSFEKQCEEIVTDLFNLSNAVLVVAVRTGEGAREGDETVFIKRRGSNIMLTGALERARNMGIGGKCTFVSDDDQTEIVINDEDEGEDD